MSHIYVVCMWCDGNKHRRLLKHTCRTQKQRTEQCCKRVRLRSIARATVLKSVATAKEVAARR